MKNQPEFSIGQLEFFEKQFLQRRNVAFSESEAIRQKIARTLFGSDYHYAPTANAIRLSKLVAELSAKCSEFENITMY